jgi:hypothetical protein
VTAVERVLPPPAPACPAWCTTHRDRSSAWSPRTAVEWSKTCRRTLPAGHDDDGEKIEVVLQRAAFLDFGTDVEVLPPAVYLEFGGFMDRANVLKLAAALTQAADLIREST